MDTLRVYSRQGCHLCEDLIEQRRRQIMDDFYAEVAQRYEVEVLYRSWIPSAELTDEGATLTADWPAL